MQRRATRFILKNSSNLCYKDRLIKLKLLPLNYWLEYLDLVFFLKCLYGHIDLTRSCNYYFSFVTSQTRQACSGLNLWIKNNRTSTFRDFYFNMIANLSNNIPNDVRQAEPIDSFKRKLKHRRTGNFLPRGGGGGAVNHLPKNLASCPNFCEAVQKKGGSYDGLT